MHDNASSSYAPATQTFLASLGIQGEKLMMLAAMFGDLNLIENFWSIIERDVYVNGRQFTSKIILWEAINTAARAVPRVTI